MDDIKNIIILIIFLFAGIAANAQTGELKPSTEGTNIGTANDKVEHVQETENKQEDVAFLFNYKQLNRQTNRKSAVC